MSGEGVVAQSLRRQFGGRVAVDGVDLRIDRGEILALVGPNGAGKTTTVRMLAALLRPSAGTCLVNSYDVVRQADQVRRSVGVMTDVPALYADMVLRSYLLWFARLYELPRLMGVSRADALIDQFDLTPWRHAPLATLSRGMQQKVALARSLLHEPVVLLLDEPTATLDVEATFALRELFRTLKASGRAIVLCTHNLAEAERVADSVAILIHGRIVHRQRRSDEAAARYRIRLAAAAPIDLNVLTAVPGLEPSSLRRVDDGIEYATRSPRETNPHVAAALVAAGAGLIELAPAAASLEEIYLRKLQEVRHPNGSAHRG